jgi:Domain of unknown function (DUF4349)
MNKMPIVKIAAGLCLAISLAGCQKNERAPMQANEILMDSTANAFVSSSAAVENNQDSTRKFIRTADLKFKVSSVIQATYNIENSTQRHGGFVAYTNLASKIDKVTNTAVSADSSLETTHYTVTNTLSLRVPNTKLDTILKEISRNIDYLDYRIIQADDVALQVLANDLTQIRTAKNEKRLTKAIDNRGKKLKETTAAEDLLLNSQEQADNAKVSNLQLADQINFSTVKLLIYQRPTIKREMLPNQQNIRAYQPHFGHRMLESLQQGWSALAAIVLFLTQLWGVFLVAGVAYFVYRRYAPSRK